MAGRDLTQVDRNDLGVMAAGAVAFIASFLPYWGVSYDIAGVGSFSSSINAWHSYAVLGLLLVFAAAALVAVRVFSSAELPEIGVGWHLVVAGLAVLGTLLLILRGFTYPHASVPGGSYGVRWGGYLLFIAGIAETVFAVLAFRSSGESLPGRSHPPAGPPAV